MGKKRARRGIDLNLDRRQSNENERERAQVRFRGGWLPLIWRGRDARGLPRVRQRASQRNSATAIIITTPPWSMQPLAN